jgi:hypothetical protein
MIVQTAAAGSTGKLRKRSLNRRDQSERHNPPLVGRQIKRRNVRLCVDT